MGVNKNKSKKPSVSTIYTDEVSTDEEETVVENTEVSSGETVPETTNSEQTVVSNETENENVGESISESEEVSAPKQSKAMRQFCQFRFGDVAFFISQIELDRLNEKYAEYMDSGAALKESFANYLLEGVENGD